MFAWVKRFGAGGCCVVCALSAGAVALGTGALGARAVERGGPPREATLAADAKGDDHHGQAGAHREHVDSLMKSYLAVQKLLVQDKVEGVAAEFQRIRKAANSLADAEDKEVVKQAKAIAKQADVEPKDLKQARERFKLLSSAVIALVQRVRSSADVAPVLYQVTCGMEKASWLQDSKEVANPYMGQRMTDCGTIERKIDSAPTAEKKN